MPLKLVLLKSQNFPSTRVLVFGRFIPDPTSLFTLLPPLACIALTSTCTVTT